MRWLPAFGAWRAGAAEDALEARWVVVDCETSGLDAARDRLISIGAVGVAAGRIPADDRFEALLRQAAPSDAANIAVHGIGREAQREGREPAEALAAFITYSRDAPIAGFHAGFDRAVLERAVRACRLSWRRRWLDLAQLLPVLFPGPQRAAFSLDAWLAHFGIAHPARHDALADAYASAQLLQVALAEARQQRLRSVADVLGAAASGRWAGAWLR